MAYNVIVSQDAHNDIDNCIGYIVNNLKNPIAAKKLLDKIEKSYFTLSDNPHIYAFCNDERLCKDGYRKVVINNFVLIYRVDDTVKTVYVIRFFYGRQNYIEMI